MNITNLFDVHSRPMMGTACQTLSLSLLSVESTFACRFLFPLEKGLFFIHKPVMYIRYETIASIEFARVDAKSKSFDMIVSRRGGEGNLAFTQINREEYGPLLEFLRSRQVHIVNIANEEQLARDTDEAVVSQSGRRIRASADTELGLVTIL